MMSLAETYSAATASMVVSPATTGTSCIGPQAVGVIAPENDPVPVAPAAPAKSVSSATARMPPATSPGRSFMSVPPGVGENAGVHIPTGVANRTFWIDGSVSRSSRARLCVSLAALLLPALSCGHKPPSAQALRTCVDRWNQGNMVGWGPGPANVAFRRPNAKERSNIELSSQRQCIVGIAVGDGTWTCVLSSTGAYWCPPLHEPTGPRLPENAGLSRRGVLELDSPPTGTHPTRPLRWFRYPRVDGYIHPWTSGGRLRSGLRFKGERRGRCFLVSETERSAVSCLYYRTMERDEACFPRRRPWRRGDLAACSWGPGSTTFTRWVITQGSDPPIFYLWGRVGDISLGELKIEVEAEYGSEPTNGYRLHGSRVVVGYDRGQVSDIRFSSPYYRTKGDFGVGSRTPRGRRWHGFVWNAWVRERPCSCWVKVGRGPRSLPATPRNFLKPWFFIDVRRGRVSGFYFALRFV